MKNKKQLNSGRHQKFKWNMGEIKIYTNVNYLEQK